LLELRRFLGEFDFSYTKYNSFDMTLVFHIKAGASTASFVAEKHSHTRLTTGHVKSRRG